MVCLGNTGHVAVIPEWGWRSKAASSLRPIISPPWPWRREKTNGSSSSPASEWLTSCFYVKILSLRSCSVSFVRLWSTNENCLLKESRLVVSEKVLGQVIRGLWAIARPEMGSLLIRTLRSLIVHRGGNGAHPGRISQASAQPSLPRSLSFRSLLSYPGGAQAGALHSVVTDNSGYVILSREKNKNKRKNNF